MEAFYRLLSFLGGLALFLYGMHTLSGGLKSSSGGALRAVLSKVTGHPVKGFLLGVLVTCIIQSSTATIVLTVGLVGAGFLTFRQSASIVLGANVGTAITSQIIRLMDLNAGNESILYFFKSDNLAPVALIVGIVLILFVKSRWADAVGTVFVGFGIMFVGLMDMSSAASALGDAVSGLLVSFEGNIFLGFLSGALVTMLIQSSSAAVGILQSLASSVGVSFCAVFPVIVGVNIGDCITTFLVCRVGATREQIRTCLIHIVYNILAAILIFAGVGILRATGVLGDGLWYAELRSGGVANIHGLFRLIPSVLLLPFADALSDLCIKLVPDKPDEGKDAGYFRELDQRLISNPGMAMNEVRRLITNMADVSLESYEGAVAQIFSYDPSGAKRVREQERRLDRMADAANQYLVAIAPYIRLEADYRNQVFQIRALACFEQISDLSAHITDNAESLWKSGLELSDQARKELRVLTGAVRDILNLSRSALESERVEDAQRIEPLEEVIDELTKKLKNLAVHRSASGRCAVVSGVEYQNILQNLERISDQCSDLAVYLLSKRDDEINGREHEYIRELHHSGDSGYIDVFQAERERYFAILDDSLKGDAV